MAGIMWMGLLWYLNFVQTPTVPKIEPAEHRAAITKFIAPNVLFWFRYAALATVDLRPACWPGMKGYLVQALTFQKPVHTIGIGMWLALIMAFNVWFIIWPNQKKVLGLVEASADEKAAAGAARRHDLAHQHHALDPDALLHGGAAERAAVSQATARRPSPSRRSHRAGRPAWRWLPRPRRTRSSCRRRGLAGRH